MTLVQRKIVTLALVGAGLQVCGVGFPSHPSAPDDGIRTSIADSNSQSFQIADSMPTALKSVFQTSAPNSNGICPPNSGNKPLGVFNDNAAASGLTLIAPPSYLPTNTGFQGTALTCGNS